MCAHFGRLHAVVNNAARFEHDDVASFGHARMERHWRTNVAAPVLLARALHARCAYRFNIEMQNFSGWNKAGNNLTLWGNKDEVPEIQPFPSTTNSELFRTLQDLTTEQIARATMVPSVLANIQSGASLGGDGNNIGASVKLMQQRVAKTQALFERVYTELLSHFRGASFGQVDIINYNPYPEQQQLDPLIWEALPMESKLAWIKKNTEFEIPETVAQQPAAPSTHSRPAAMPA